MALYVIFDCATCENENCTGHGLPTTEKVCYGYKHTTTNADRIRAMTDEELAELLTAVAQKSAKKLCESLKTVEVDLSNCNFHILYEAHIDWLKEEAT